MWNFIPWNEIQIFTFFFTLLRVTSVLIFAPIFGDKAVPPLVKILFGVALSAVIFPFNWASGIRIDSAVINSPTKILFSCFVEITFGVMLGFVAKWIFDAVLVAGNFLGNAIGFSMASILDPHSEQQTTAISEFHYIIAALLFLSFNGHHIYLDALMSSFKFIKIGSLSLFQENTSLFDFLLAMTNQVIVIGLKLSMPVTIVILVMNLTYGVLARAVPQVNALVLSFASNVLIGLLVVVVSLPAFTSMLDTMFDSYQLTLLKFIQLFGK
jgi:flagellar biosynthetic protein FliR